MNRLRCSKLGLQGCTRGEKRVTLRPGAWKALTGGFVKVNWDAHVDMINRRIGIGVLVRDYIGEVLATLLAKKKYTTDPIVPKAIATLRAIVFIRELRVQNVKLDGDALQIVHAL